MFIFGGFRDTYCTRFALFSAVGDVGCGSNLGGVEEPGAVRAVDCVEGHGVGDAGDKIADVSGAGERGHGIAIGGFSVSVRIPLTFFALRAALRASV
jgi:hypothetical protein